MQKITQVRQFSSSSPNSLASESDSFFVSLLQSIQDAVVATDLEYRIIGWNAAAEKLYGWKEIEVLGKKARDVLKTTFLTASADEWRSVIKKNGHWSGTVIQYTKNELPLYLHASTSLVKNNKGKVIGAVAVNRDYTDKKASEEQLQFQANILSNVRDSIIVTDMKGIVTYWNQGAQNLFGYTTDEVIGKPVSLVYSMPKKKNLKEDLSQIVKGKDFIGEWKGKKKDGQEIWLDIKTTPLFDKEKNVQGFIGIARDITERKNMEGKIRFLAEAKTLLTSSLDYQRTLKNVAKIAVPTIADWCEVDLLDENGQIQQIVLHHNDPKKIALGKKLREIDPLDIAKETGIAKVIKTNEPEFYPFISKETILASAKSKEHAEILEKIGFTSALIVPLKALGKTIGAITFVTSESRRQLNTYDRQIIEQLASRAALAIENAMLYKEVAEEEQRLRELLANVPGLVWEAYGKPDETQQRIDFVSDYVESMLGYTVEEWLGTPNFWLKIVHPDDKKRAAEESVRIFTSKKGGISRFRWMTKDNNILWVEAHSFVIKNKIGKPIGMRGVTMDITQRMENENRKDEFISMASHELKTPITSMKVFTQILQKPTSGITDEKPRRYLQRMDEQLDKLTHLVNDLLDVSKIQAGKLSFKKHTFSLHELLQEVVENMQEITKDHAIRIRGTNSIAVHADRHRIGQVLINLLSNAIKYSPDNKEIIVTLAAKKDEVVVSVKDYGVGIDPIHQEKIFERFYRVYDNTDRTFPGLGMGLFISGEIIRRHTGRIWVKSKKGQGSTFYISLPIHEVQ